MCDELKYSCNHLQKVKDTFSATENLEFVCPENTWLHHYQIFNGAENFLKVARAQQIFPKLKLTKTYLHTTMTQHTLYGLTKL